MNDIIGYINFSDIILEKQVGNKINFAGGIGECKIQVYSNEGNIPHFHLDSINGNFSSCICIYSNNYFSHGGKYTNTLTHKKHREELDNWLRNTGENGNTNWENIVLLWESRNPNCKFPKNRKTFIQPDYSSILNFKDK